MSRSFDVWYFAMFPEYADLTQSLAPGAVSPMLVYDDPRYSLAPLLWFMDLSRNKIRQLPAWILRLPSLSCLDLSYNRVSLNAICRSAHAWEMTELYIAAVYWSKIFRICAQCLPKNIILHNVLDELVCSLCL